MSLYFLIAFIAAAISYSGFLWSRQRRLDAECQVAGHQWVPSAWGEPAYYLACHRCGKKLPV